MDEIEAIPDVPGPIDNEPDSVDMSTLKECFPAIFKTFSDMPEWTVLAALESASMDEKRAIRNLKAKRKAVKELGVDFKSAEKLEHKVYIEKREVAEKREVSMMEQRDMRDAEERQKKMSAGERSIELAKTEADYLTVEREVLVAPAWMNTEGQPCAVSEAEALQVTRLEDSTEDPAGYEEAAAVPPPPKEDDVSADAGAAADDDAVAAADFGRQGVPLRVRCRVSIRRRPLGYSPALILSTTITQSSHERSPRSQKLEEFYFHDRHGQLARLEVERYNSSERARARASATLSACHPPSHRHVTHRVTAV